jgi:predicted ester cyclase
MSAEETSRAYFAALAKRDPEAMAALWKPGCIDRLHGLFELRAPGEIRDWFSNLFAAFPELEVEVLDVVSSGDQAAIRWRARGAFTGTASFEGLQPNGAELEMNGCDLLTVEGDQIVANEAYMNGADLARQLGAMPPAGSMAERGMLGALNLKTRAAGLLRR